MDDTLHIASLQYDLIWEDKDQNLKKIDRFIHAIDEPMDLIVLPEMFSTGFTMNGEKLAESEAGPTVAWMRNHAVKMNCCITGSLVIREGERLFNRFIAVTASGIIVRYDKRHLFRMGEEHHYYHRGEQRVVFQLGPWRIAPFICYDLRFPVWMRNLGDYDLLLVVANWPASRRDVWKNLLVARAIENQVYFIAVNRVGRDEFSTFFGHTSIIGPWGELISGSGEEECVVLGEIDMSRVYRVRKKIPCHTILSISLCSKIIQ